MLSEENLIVQNQLGVSREECRMLDVRATRAEMLSKEMKRALNLSKEESKILDSERQRLKLENLTLARAIEKMDKMVYGHKKMNKTTREVLHGRIAMSRSFTAGDGIAAAAAVSAVSSSSEGVATEKENMTTRTTRLTTRTRLSKRALREREKKKKRLTKSFSVSRTSAVKSGGGSTRGGSSLSRRVLRDPTLR